MFLAQLEETRAQSSKQDPVVQKLEITINRTNHYPADRYWGNRWIEIYLVDSVVHLLNNWDKDITNQETHNNQGIDTGICTKNKQCMCPKLLYTVLLFFLINTKGKTGTFQPLHNAQLGDRS